MCVSRFNPTEPGCDDVPGCLACPSVNWNHYTLGVSWPQSEVNRQFQFGPLAIPTNPLVAEYRRIAADRLPLNRSGGCFFSGTGFVEFATDADAGDLFDDDFQSLDDSLALFRDERKVGSLGAITETPYWFWSAIPLGDGGFLSNEFRLAVSYTAAEWQLRIFRSPVVHPATPIDQRPPAGWLPYKPIPAASWQCFGTNEFVADFPAHPFDNIPPRTITVSPVRKYERQPVIVGERIVLEGAGPDADPFFRSSIRVATPAF